MQERADSCGHLRSQTASAAQTDQREIHVGFGRIDAK